MESSPSEFPKVIRLYGEEFTTYDALATFLAAKHENFRRVFRTIPPSDSVNQLADADSIKPIFSPNLQTEEIMDAVSSFIETYSCNLRGGMLLSRLQGHSLVETSGDNDDNYTPMARPIEMGHADCVRP
jgi:hypothetical protein